MNVDEHPGLEGGAAAWVESLRQDDERLDSETPDR